MAGAHPHGRRAAAALLAPAPAPPLRRARRPFPRGLLLGLVLHDARARRERAARARRRHGPELRLADRPLRARPERKPDLLPQPFAAAVLRLDGAAPRGARRR